MAGYKEPSGKRNRPSTDEKEEAGNDTFQDSKRNGEVKEQNDAEEEQVNHLRLNMLIIYNFIHYVFDVFIKANSEISDTNNDGSSTHHTLVLDATNSSTSSSGIS